MGFGWHPIYEMENKRCLKPPTSQTSHVPCFQTPKITCATPLLNHFSTTWAGFAGQSTNQVPCQAANEMKLAHQGHIIIIIALSQEDLIIYIYIWYIWYIRYNIYIYITFLSCFLGFESDPNKSGSNNRQQPWLCPVLQFLHQAVTLIPHGGKTEIRTWPREKPKPAIPSGCIMVV